MSTVRDSGHHSNQNDNQDHATKRSEVLDLLTDPNRWEEAVTVALDQSTDGSTLRLLAKGSYWLRVAVATNPSCPPTLLTRLGSDEIDVVRRRVACNPSTPPVTRRRLTNDPVEMVSCAARDALGRAQPL